ncbi:hypothetical protein GCM10010168_27120 [Actinoplanes ianthinogenes]|uniref:Gp5/Type VI secretion system Vgr protein OB-fold domain-containing protein n=1 Tax=Actinoplanes ianthinogenes TaxID=122358 RepID=A0ABN6C5T0_9ACTN|nr:phage baseplate assembly protein V [Actinoplanes ianthinogenes]BCJ39852.1 hypothetical protein Aiant_05090 [Actinoplanes ianthinogenes]GGR08586.1 hypothetical protein GCM10010168_27120 [Actinoplanes ianthinogenes]
MGAVRGVVIGIVRSLDDQKHRGQVEVEFPAERGEQTVPVRDWARVATPFAGPGRGLWLMPEVGDEVLVACVGEDPADPYVIGALWSEPPGTVAAPPAGAKPGQRLIRSVTGHTVLLDDDGDRVEVRHQGGARISLDAGQVELVMGGRRIRMTGDAIEFS